MSNVSIAVHRILRKTLFFTTVLGPLAAYSQSAPNAELTQSQGAAAAPSPEMEEIIVTAQKRQESLQDVPASITAIPAKLIEEMKIESITDVIKLLPSVDFISQGPGQSHFFFRGISSGEAFNPSAAQPTVGVYLNEQPITTITGELDLHMYDIARIEALAGPQGTLYGSSSEAGTIRIITNQPELNHSEVKIDAIGSMTQNGDPNNTFEGVINEPLGENAAIRLVGWTDHEGGYVNNVYQTTYFPNAGLLTNNAGAVKDDFNDVQTEGGRVSLLYNLNDRWTIEPMIQGQKQLSHGIFAYETQLGLRDTGMKIIPYQDDRWIQAGLTVLGKVGSLDLTYAGSYLDRHIDGISDYSDYSYFYDIFYDQVNYNNAGKPIDPSQEIHDQGEHFSLWSHELRVASDQTARLRFQAGVFAERQAHLISQYYDVNDLGTAQSVPGLPGTWWLTREQRVDRDYAGFGEVSYDILPKLTATVGGRLYRYDNTLVGYSSNSSPSCVGPAVVPGTPCTTVGVLNANGTVSPSEAEKDGSLHKVNLDYKFDTRHMMYFTWSDGYRPGGINRYGAAAPYQPDYLTNYEFGAKTSWFDNRLRANAAIYYETWDNIQFSHIQNFSGFAITIVDNAGNATVKGFEYSIEATPVRGLTVSTMGSFNDASLRENYCLIKGPADCSGAGNAVLAPAGTPLPITPRFKGTTFLRYEQPLAGSLSGFTAHTQASVSYQTSARNDLKTSDFAVTGELPGYSTTDLEVGLANTTWTFDLFAKNVFNNEADQYRYAECLLSTCGGRLYAYFVHSREIGLHVGAKF